MNENNIWTFCDMHRACGEGRQWAIAHCHDMAEAWDKLPPEWLVWVATRPGVLPKRTLSRFACWCARFTPLGDGRTTWDILTDERSRHAVKVAGLFAQSRTSRVDVAGAINAAWAAVWAVEAADISAAHAAWAAVWAVEAADISAARVAAVARMNDSVRWESASSAAAAAWGAARSGASASGTQAAAFAFHAAHLRSIVANPFKRGT